MKKKLNVSAPENKVWNIWQIAYNSLSSKQGKAITKKMLLKNFINLVYVLLYVAVL